MRNQSGFTLIELIIVIVILGILAVVAAPRFIDISEDAHRSTVKGIASAFKGSNTLIYGKWLVRGNKQAQDTFIEIEPNNGIPSGGKYLSVNEYGYPSDTRNGITSLSTKLDCIEVWTHTMNTDLVVNNSDTGDFIAEYTGSNSCRYTLADDTQFSIDYNSITGEVTANL